MAGAVAGRPIAVRFVDERTIDKQQDVKMIVLCSDEPLLLTRWEKPLLYAWARCAYSSPPDSETPYAATSVSR